MMNAAGVTRRQQTHTAGYREKIYGPRLMLTEMINTSSSYDEEEHLKTGYMDDRPHRIEWRRDHDDRRLNHHDDHDNRWEHHHREDRGNHDRDNEERRDRDGRRE